MADLSITAASFVPGANAKTKQGTAGETITAGQPLYQKSSDNRIYKADANLSVEASTVIGISCHGASAGQPIVYVYEDDDLTPGATLSMSAPIYVASSTAGGIAPCADIVAGWYPTVVFVAKSTSKAVMKLTAGGAITV